MEQHNGLYPEARRCYAASINTCPSNLLWKIWLSGSRMELRAERPAASRLLLQRARAQVPRKARVLVLMEQARVAEYSGEPEAARALLQKAKSQANDWKLFFELVLLEARAGRYVAAIHEAEEALKVHSGTGRLWAVLIQLNQVRPACHLRVVHLCSYALLPPCLPLSSCETN